MGYIVNFLKYLYYRPQHVIIHFFSNLFSKRLDADEMDNVLIVSPHPDDEVFGCANLINILAEQGKKVNIVYLSKGEASISSDKCDKQELIMARKNLAIQANSILGVKSEYLFFLDFPDGHFDNVSHEQIEQCKLLIEQIKPQYMFYPHPYDGSPDHKIATKVLQQIVSEMDITQYYYCVWLWHHMSLYKVLLLNYFRSYVLKGNQVLKSKAIDIYTSALSRRGDFYSGALPKMFIKAIHWNKELYFEKR